LLKTTLKCHSKLSVGTTNIYIRFQVLTAVIDKLVFYCWFSAHILDKRFKVSEKAPPKLWNARLLRFAESQ